MSGFQVGEIVDITIRRARVVEDTSVHHCLKVSYRQPEHLRAAPYTLVLPLRSPDLTVERSVPAEYPPVPGDLWQTIEDTELSAPTYWAAVNVDHLADGVGVRLICASYHEDGSWLTTPEDLLKQGRVRLIAPSPLRNTNGGDAPGVPVPVTAHHQTAGWGGVPGECGVECACGTVFNNFDTIAEAAALLDAHIAGTRKGGDR